MGPKCGGEEKGGFFGDQNGICTFCKYVSDHLRAFRWMVHSGDRAIGGKCQLRHTGLAGCNRFVGYKNGFTHFRFSN